MKNFPLPCKLLLTLLLLLLHPMAFAAVIVDSPSLCPTGTTATALGNGFLSNGQFFPDSAFGTPFFRCDENSINEALVEQQSERIRQNTGTIMYHVFDSMVGHAGQGNQAAVSNANKLAASADSGSYKPDVFWGETSFSGITDDGQSIDIDNRIYQFTGGLDKRLGNFFFGSALSYTYANLEITGSRDTDSHGFGISPYMAYQLNDFLFASALAGYYYSNASGGSSADLHDYVGEINLNAFKVINSFIIKGRAGARYNHNYTSSPGLTNPRHDQWTALADLEIGYHFNNGPKVYVGSLYEHTDRSQSSVNSALRDSVFFMRFGLDYEITQAFSLGAKIETDLSDSNKDIVQGALSARLEI